MSFKRKFIGVLLAVVIMTGGLGMNGSVAQAKDLGDTSEYCPINEVLDLAYTIHKETEIISTMISNKVIGWNGSGGSGENTKYLVSGSDINNFWTTMRKYMFPIDANDEAWEHNWTHDHLFDDVDADGNSNWTTIDGVRYLTSVKRSEIAEATNAMNAVLEPFRSILEKEGSGKKDSGESRGSGHTHNFVEATVSEASETADKVVTLECTICGQQQSHVTLLGTAVNEFIKDTVTKLEKAPANGSVTIDTEIWTCFNRTAVEAIKSRPDVEVTVNFMYKNAKYTFTIPAGYGTEQLDALLDENGYCGFMYLLSVFNGHSL